MKKFLVFAMLSSLLIFGGCSRQAPPPYNIATSIKITCQHQDVLIERNYTSQEKMKKVLTYLRVIRPRGVSQTNPVLQKKDVYQIQVQLPSGKTHIYQQTAHRFFKSHGKPWMHISPEDAVGLYAIIARYESDPDVSVITSEADL